MKTEDWMEAGRILMAWGPFMPEPSPLERYNYKSAWNGCRAETQSGYRCCYQVRASYSRDLCALHTEEAFRARDRVLRAEGWSKPNDYVLTSDEMRNIAMALGMEDFEKWGGCWAKWYPPQPPQAERDWVLYRWWDDNQTLLYVGKSGSVAKRLADHVRTKNWTKDAVTVSLEHFESERALSAAEATAIRTEDPKYNIVGKL